MPDYAVEIAVGDSSRTGLAVTDVDADAAAAQALAYAAANWPHPRGDWSVVSTRLVLHEDDWSAVTNDSVDLTADIPIPDTGAVTP
jgi:hypothetical protein